MDTAHKTARMSFHSIAGRCAAAAFLIALAVCACTPEPEPGPPYLGHWESLYRGRGGEANGLVIKADSTVERLTFYAFDFHYSVAGDTLRLIPILPDSFLPVGATEPPVFTNLFKITGDTLVRSDSGLTEWLVREGKPEAGPESIVGIWRVARSSAANMTIGFARFTADSLLQVRKPADVRPGRYVAKINDQDTLPDSLTFYFPDDTSRCELTWKGDTLQFARTFVNGLFTFGYLRQGDARWYRKIELP